MKVTDFDYNLPEERIAQQPTDKRDQSRLMVIHRDTNTREHRHFFDLPQYLKPGDCLVLNNSKVLPARLFGKKRSTGANIELLLTQEVEPNQWLCLAKPGKRLKPGDMVDIVLGKVPQIAIPKVKQMLADAGLAVRLIVSGEMQKAQERFNAKPSKASREREIKNSEAEA